MVPQQFGQHKPDLAKLRNILLCGGGGILLFVAVCAKMSSLTISYEEPARRTHETPELPRHGHCDHRERWTGGKGDVWPSSLNLAVDRRPTSVNS